jgi:hypothetical protein
MALVITKLANNMVEVTGGPVDYTLLPSYQVEEAPDLDGVRIVREGKMHDKFDQSNITQVVRQDGTIVAISDAQTLYDELSVYFFFELGGSGGGVTPVTTSYAELIQTGDWVLDGGSGRYYYDLVHSLNTKDLLIEAYETATDDTYVFDDYERTDVNTVRVWSTINTVEARVLISNGGSAVVIATTTEGTEETGNFAPVSQGGVVIPVNSASDVTVTINTSSMAEGEAVYFRQVGAGRILLTDGNLSSVAYVNKSYISGGVGAFIGAWRVNATEYTSIGDLQ